jgi:uncharacterized protein (DUF983 family)
MATGVIDRCPVCGKGSLHPRGYRKRQENPSPEGGFRPESDLSEYECDTCHQVVRVGGVHDYGKGVDSASTAS